MALDGAFADKMFARLKRKEAALQQVRAQFSGSKPKAIRADKEFQELLERFVNEGLSKQQAANKIAKEFPELLTSWVKQANKRR